MFLHAGQSQACLETREQLEARLRATPQIHHESKRAHTEPRRMWAPRRMMGPTCLLGTGTGGPSVSGCSRTDHTWSFLHGETQTLCSGLVQFQARSINTHMGSFPRAQWRFSRSDPVDCSLPGCSSPGKNTGKGCHFLLQIFLTQGWNLGLLHCRWILYQRANDQPAV